MIAELNWCYSYIGQSFLIPLKCSFCFWYCRGNGFNKYHDCFHLKVSELMMKSTVILKTSLNDFLMFIFSLYLSLLFLKFSPRFEIMWKGCIPSLYDFFCNIENMFSFGDKHFTDFCQVLSLESWLKNCVLIKCQHYTHALF